MPPKKKQEQIDLATLPPWTSKNSMVVCSGLKSRATAIIDTLKRQPNKYLKFVTRNEVIDHAKQKGMYVDPNTLTDKQKKDTKFMSEVCTELTPEILAKAATSLINNVLNVKYRVEKKNKLEGKDQAVVDEKKGAKKEGKKDDKKVEEPPKPPVEEKQYTKNFDSVYVFEGYPAQQQEYVELAKANQNIAYVLNVKPIMLVPKLDEEEQDEEQIAKNKQLKEKQTPKDQDTKHQQSVDNFLTSIVESRRSSAPTSEFRNTLIRDLVVEIEPATEAETMKGLNELIFETLCELSIERAAFDEWHKTKQSVPLTTKAIDEKELKPVSFQASAAKTPISLLLDLASQIEKRKTKEEQDAQQEKNTEDFIQDLLNTSAKQLGIKTKQSKQGDSSTIPASKKYIHSSDWHGVNSQNSLTEKEILNRLRYPGLQRVSMPQIPDKSPNLRKAQSSQYVNFIKEGAFGQFERASKITFFEKLATTADEYRQYDFGDRVFEERLNQKALAGVLHEALLEHPEVISKYNPKDDSLYLVLLHRRPPGNVLHKKWNCDWRVLPNFENWLNYFKNNQNNLKNNEFYNIDYEKLLNITENSKIVYPSDNSMIVVDRRNIGGRIKTSVKVNKDKIYFGLSAQDKSFWYCNDGTRVTIVKEEDQPKIVVSLQNGLVIVLYQNGQVYQRVRSNPGRLTLPSGHTIVYNKESPVEIQHPNGSLSYPPNKYTGVRGLGQESGQAKTVPTLHRTTDTHSLIKRDDETLIVENNGKKWVRFGDGTGLERNNETIIIESDKFARFTVIEDGFILNIDDLKIQGRLVGEGKYSHSINFSDASQIYVDLQGIYCLDGGEKARHAIGKDSFHVKHNEIPSVYMCNLNDHSLSTEHGNIKVYATGNIEIKDGDKVKVIDQNEPQLSPEEIKALPLSKDIIQPRLLVISPDSTGTEYYTGKQLDDYKRLAMRHVSSSQGSVKEGEAQLLTFATEIAPASPKKIVKPNYPQGLDVLPNLSNTVETQINGKTFELRVIQAKNALDETSRKQFSDVLQAYEQWKNEEIKHNNQYGFTELSKEALEQAFKEKENIMKQRRAKTPENPYERRLKQLVEKVEKDIAEKDKIRKSEKGLLEKPVQSSSKEQIVEKKPKKSRQPRENTEQALPLSTTCFNFFATEEGKRVLGTMPDWVFKPKQRKQKTGLLIEDISRPSRGSSDLPNEKTNEDLPVENVPLSTEGQQQTMPNIAQATIIIKPSVFTQQDIEEERQIFEEEKKAFEYREVKRKDYDVYGKERREKPLVTSMLRTQPISQLNQKYILTESMTDKKVRISSMKNKLIMNAPSVTELRNEGLHQTMMKSIDKGNTLEDLAERKNLMIYADINDKLRRDILINPTEANFGVIRETGTFELKIDIKNEDVMVQRIVVKRPRTNFVKAYLSEMGPIPLGISRKVIVQLRTSPEIKGKFTDEFQIVSKHQIYKIPVVAQIVSQQAFTKMSQKEANRSILKLGVSELAPTLKAGRTSNTQILPKIQK